MGRKKKNPYGEIKLNRTQQRVFDFLVEEGSITTIQAFTEFGETRLSARIFEIRQKGVNISSEKIVVTNRFKEKRYVNKYYLG